MKFKSLMVMALCLLSSFAHASPSASHVGDPNDVLNRLNHVSTFDFARTVALTPMATILTEPVIRALWATQIFTKSDWIGIQGLASLHQHIDPGGAEGDASNLFIYTCKGGWLDLGHIINTALAYKVFLQALRGTTLLRPTVGFMLKPEESKKFHMISNQFVTFHKTATDGKLTGDLAFWAGFFAMRSGYWIEERQTKNKTYAKMSKFDANATSAYTLEDLPSDSYGIMIAERMERRNFVGGVVRAFRREITQLMHDFNAVQLKNRVHVSGCDDLAEETLKKDASYYEHLATTTRVKEYKNISSDPRSVYNFTIVPKRTLHHSCVCDSKNNPIKN